MAVCIFDQLLVQSFKPAPFTDEPDNFMSNFEPQDSVKSMTTVMDELETSGVEEGGSLLRHYLLTGLADVKTGLYSKFHENAIYKFGYGHRIAVRMAYMYVILIMPPSSCLN